MKFKKKWLTSTALALVLLIAGTVLLSPFTSSTVLAETVPLSYTTDSWQADGLYSKYSMLMTNTVIGRDGYKIKEAYVVKGTKKTKINGATGQTQYTVAETLVGDRLVVRSEENEMLEGYYAWYRYSNTGTDRDWHADFEYMDDSYHEYLSHRTCQSAIMDEWGMPHAPGCSDSNLTMVNALQNPFSTADGKTVSVHVVDRSQFKGTARVIQPLNPIPGPEGINGYPDEATITLDPTNAVDTTPDMSRIIIRFTQSFMDRSIYYKNLAAPGAQVMVYFSAFEADLEAATYHYPYTLEVTYEPINTAKPDLIAVNIKALTPIITNTPATFELEWTSSGPLADKPFVIEVNYLATNLYRKTINPGDYRSGVPKTDTFQYTFTTAGSRTFALNVDASNQIDEGTNETNNNLTRSFTAIADPGITGDFDILPSTISFRDPFKLVPKNITEKNGCTYSYHLFRLENGSTWDSPSQNGKTLQLAFSYPNQYPSPIKAGSVNVSMKIYSSCGSTDWISKSLTVNSPSDNQDPFFKVGWFHDGDYVNKTPVTQVVQGTKLMARIIEDPDGKPYPSPSDPDGDPITFAGWDFNRSSMFVKDMPGKYGFHPQQQPLTGITMDTVGYHLLYGTITDLFGGSYTAMTMVEVIPPNPIPRASCPPQVKENRPVDPSLFDASKSYSPSGRQIDHARNEWTNKLTSYVNGTSANITVQASLHVWDNGSPALKSLSPDTCSIIVEPDLPPIAKLDVPPLGIRGQSYELFNKSYSPDGDAITSVSYRYKYDGNNNGFADDGWQWLSGTATKATFAPTLVGKYMFDVIVCENYGRCATASDMQTVSTLVLDTINLAPQVSFIVSGKNPKPDVNPPISYSANTMLNNWALYETNSTTLSGFAKSTSWSVSGSSIVAGLGRLPENQQFFSVSEMSWGNSYTRYSIAPYTDNGFGSNRLSPYRAMQGYATKSFPLMLYNGTQWNPMSWTMDQRFKPGIKTNRTHMYVNNFDGYIDVSSTGYSRWKGSIHALNKSRIPNYSSTTTYFTTTHLYDVNPYDFVISSESAPTRTNTYTHYSSWDDMHYNRGGYSVNETIKPSFLAYEVSDRTIYVFVNYYGRAGCYTYDTTDENGWEVQEQSCSFKNEYGVLTFDAFTGAPIASSFSHGAAFPISAYLNQSNIAMFAKNGNVTLLAGDRGFEINRSGQKVRESAIPWRGTNTRPEINPGKNTVCYGGNSTWQRGLNGEFYHIEWDHSCQYTEYGTTSYTQGLFNTQVVKMNADFTEAWRVTTAGRQPNAEKSFGGSPLEFPNHLLVNPMRNEVIVRSVNLSGYDITLFYEAINMTTGAKTQLTDPKFYFSPTNATADIDWSGNYTANNGSNNGYSGTMTIEGWKTRFYHSDYNWDTAISPDGTRFGYPGAGGSLGVATNTNGQTFGEYVGDGQYVSGHWFSSWNNYSKSGIYLWFSQGTPTTDPAVTRPYKLGQFVSNVNVDNTELNFSMSMADADYDSEFAGFSFRMQDPRNRYAVETNGSTLYLSRYVGGSRTILQSSAFPFQDNTEYAFKITMSGSELRVSLNGVPYFSVNDGTFASGTIGPFTDKSFVSFSGVSTKAVPTQSVDWFTNYAIWESGTASAEVRYESITFTDPENDPRAGSNVWSYTHNPKFINNQGYSSMNGQAYTSERLTFDKVGEYWITLQARDDPHPSYRSPSMTFDSYRKSSNAYQQRLIVHRRPVAQLSAWVNGDGTIGYNETSYDPDRWASASNYSAPDTTGIDYGATRGIMERRFYHITPAGQYVESKLTRPTQNGTYEVGLMVRDEYGAWSYPVSQTIVVGTTPPPNSRPTATLTYPTGSQSAPTLLYTYQPMIAWNQNDTAGTVFQGYHVKISNESGAVIVESGERPQWTSANSASWAVPIPLPAGVKLQVQVRVSDGEEWSAWSNVGWMRVNSQPTATLTFPNGPSAASANLIQENRRPTIQWNQYDVDHALGTVFQGYHVQITRENGTIVYDYGASQWTQANSQSMTVTVDLPTGEPLKVGVRVSDGYLWSEWSNFGWLQINMSPSAVVTYPSGTQATPTIEGPKPTITWTQTDPDPGTIFLKYQVHIVNEANTAVVHDSGEVSQYTSAAAQSYAVTSHLPAGQKLRVRVRVFDGYVWSAWSADKWLFTNRPPQPDFDWSPKPIWEGDRVQLINRSTDPDGNPLTFLWTVRDPEGGLLTFNTKDAAARFTVPGFYTVTLTVNDGFASASVTKQLEAAPLTIDAQVLHTPEWKQIHDNKGHNTTTEPKDFYSGERFVVSATRSPAPVEEVTAWIDAVGIDGRPLLVSTRLLNTDSGVIYRGSLYDDRFLSVSEGLPEGRMPIRFRIQYVNGVTKHKEVTVNMIGNANSAISVHRRQ